MIASVKGRVGARCPDHVVIECDGVGYRLNVSARTLQELPAPGGEARLLAHLLMRDDGLHLYGFAAAEERDLFLKLISVAGVGPKMALTALSGSSVKELSRAIALGDAKRFHVVPGIGKKTAERIIVELREKLAEELSAASAPPEAADVRALAREGLVGLGYELGEAEEMLEAVPRNGDVRPEDLIAAALKASVKGR